MHLLLSVVVIGFAFVVVLGALSVVSSLLLPLTIGDSS